MLSKKSALALCALLAACTIAPGCCCKKKGKECSSKQEKNGKKMCKKCNMSKDKCGCK
ncbi:MAG: hypothetical protein H6679_05015 [Epsilonproteobacteria bacterium]|nr:hypothetical protein [Campylobacterota bacterium]